MSRQLAIGRVGLTTLLVFPCVVLIGLLTAGGSPGGNVDVAQSRLAAHQPHEILVRFHESATAEERERIRTELGGQSVRRLGSSLELLRVGSGYTTETAIERYGDHPSVRYVEPNYLVYAERLPDDPQFRELYGLHNTGQTGGTPDADIDVERAWDVTTGSRDVVVAVLDSGVDYRHSDLIANIWTNPGEIPDNGIDDDGNGRKDDVHFRPRMLFEHLPFDRVRKLSESLIDGEDFDGEIEMYGNMKVVVA